MKTVYARPKSLKDAPFHYCPGCGHSIVHRLMCEIIDEMGLQDRIIGIPPPGCSVFAYNYFDIDMAESAHGRGAAHFGHLKSENDAVYFVTGNERIMLPRRLGPALSGHREGQIVLGIRPESISLRQFSGQSDNAISATVNVP